jgi:hypothetical protein
MSKDDRLNEMRQRVADYVSIGVKDVWVIDPWRRVAYEETASGLSEPADGVLRVSGTSVEISLVEIFRQLDEF